MLKTIIMHEMQRYFLSRIFQVALSVLIFLVLVTTIIGADDYVRRRQDYLDAVREMGWNPESKEMNVFRPPQPLSALAAGKDRIFGVRKYLNTMNLEGGVSSYMEQELSTAGQMLNNIPLVDAAFVMRIYFSLFVMFIGFTAIAGEKETGTLRQVIASSIPRNTLILGKFTAGMIILAFSLAASGVAAFAVMMFHPQVPFGNAEAVRTMLFFGAAFLYGLVFFAGSMAVSVIADRSSTSLLFLFQLWIVLVVLAPNLGAVAAERFSPVRSEIFNERSLAIQKEINAEIKALVPMNNNDLAMQRDKFYHKMSAEVYRQTIRPFEQAKNRQAELSYQITSFSPAMIFDRIVYRLARTDGIEFTRFTDQFFQYWDTIYAPDNWMYVSNNPPRFAYLESSLEDAFTSRI